MLNLDLQNHRPLREIVYEELKRQILVGEIAPGTRMMEVELAEDMGVSRTPVREAIRKLEKEGLVTIEPRRGAYASDISIKDMVDVLEVRQMLEGMAASMAAQKVTEEEKLDFVEANSAYKNAVKKGNIEEIIRYDELFHQLIVSYSGNKTLNQLLSQVQELALRFRYIYYDDFSRYENMPVEHEEIEEAIISGDTQKAKVVAEEHVERLKKFVIDEGKNLFQNTKENEAI
ncbi:MAG: GntR family transcriptional regulator [Candidatus Fimisoma sp.]|nr:GntR family transcriptional regulator [Bacillota bacterium]MDD7285863.1 GntR family transcriptional regulator [Bacillota bacterium]MDY4748904.1 GntR family transcriptional regulator [Candidatus Fimisoma sp.]